MDLGGCFYLLGHTVLCCAALYRAAVRWTACATWVMRRGPSWRLPRPRCSSSSRRRRSRSCWCSSWRSVERCLRCVVVLHCFLQCYGYPAVAAVAAAYQLPGKAEQVAAHEKCSVLVVLNVCGELIRFVCGCAWEWWKGMSGCAQQGQQSWW